MHTAGRTKSELNLTPSASRGSTDSATSKKSGATGSTSMSRFIANDPKLSGVKLRCNFRKETIEAFQALPKNSHCTAMVAEGNGIDDHACAELEKNISKNTTLTYLSLGKLEVSSNGLQSLAAAVTNSRSLRVLKVGPISKPVGVLDRGLSFLLKNVCESETVTRFELHETTFLTAANFAKYLPRARVLNSLVLDKIGMTDEIFSDLAEGLKGAKKISVLVLSGLAGSPEAMSKVFSVYHSATALTKLGVRDIHACRQPSAMASLAGLVTFSTRLTELEVSGSKVSTEGGSLLFRAALTSPSLQVLNLANNELTDVRALDMTKATLTDLNLRGNKLHHETLSQFAEQLSKNKSLTRLNLANNIFTADSARNYLNASVLTSSSKLKDILFDETDEKKEAALAAVTKANSTSTTPRGTLRSSVSKNKSKEQHGDEESERADPNDDEISFAEISPTTSAIGVSAHSSPSGGRAATPLSTSLTSAGGLHHRVGLTNPIGLRNSAEAAKRLSGQSVSVQSAHPPNYAEILRLVLQDTQLRAQLRAALFPEVKEQINQYIQKEVSTLVKQRLSVLGLKKSQRKKDKLARAAARAGAKESASSPQPSPQPQEKPV